MTGPASPSAHAAGVAPLAVALGGMVALASAMGLGRFLYTPVLPMMVDGAGLAPAAGGLVAAANFAGYLAGALAAAVLGLPGGARAWTIGALGAGALAAGAMALTDAPLAWAALRFAGGAASAFVLVLASSLVVQSLAAAGRPALASVHFSGVGVGILLSAWIASPALAGPADWRSVWIAGAVLMAAGLPAAARLIPERPVTAGVAADRTPAAPGLWRLVAGYGCLGFGYVVTATFIVAILREGAAGRWAETWVWSAVGLAAIPSVALWARAARRFGAVAAWRAAMLIEAAGVALSAVLSGPLALGIAAAALGGTFMGLTALGLQEAARRAGGADGRRIMALMTAAFGTGQMIGPALGGAMREATGSYAAASALAALVLLAGAALMPPGPAAPDRRPS